MNASGTLVGRDAVRFERPHPGPIFDSLQRWELTMEGQQVRLVWLHSRLTDKSLPQFGAGSYAVLDCLDAALRGREVPSIIDALVAIEPTYEARFA